MPNLTICIENIKNDKGMILLAFYRNEMEFEDDKPFRSITISKDSIKNNSLCITYNFLSTGTYGIALLDDENENFRMDYKLLLPREGFGFSGYYPEKLTKPGFDDFIFHIGNEGKTISIQIRYVL